MYRVKRHLEHELRLNLAHRPEAVHGVVSHPAVELPQLLVGEAKIGFADRNKLGLSAVAVTPGAEGVLGLVGRALAAAALRVHEHGVQRERRPFPLEPVTLRAPRNVGTVAPLEHQPFDACFARTGPQRLEIIDRREVDDARNVGSRWCLRGVPRFEPRTALDERKRAETVAPIEHNTVDTNIVWT